MAAQAFSLSLPPRLVRLTVVGCTVAFLVYLAGSIVAGMLDADDQIADLRTSYASFVAQATASKPQTTPSGPRPQQALIASGKEAATSLIQHILQQSVEPPAKLESLHILDASDEKGLVVVRASVRIRNLAPERVADLVHRIEGTVPAILFDDLRVSIHTRPGVFGSVGPGAGVETNSAEVSGVVRTYAMSTTDQLPSATAGPQP